MTTTHDIREDPHDMDNPSQESSTDGTDAPAAGALHGDAPRPRLLHRLVVVVAVLSVVATGAWAVRERDRADAAESELARSRSAALVAGSFVESLLTYDYDDLESQRDAVAAGSTDHFREEFLTAFTDDLADAIRAEEASSRASVRDTFITHDDDGAIRALVTVESEVRSARGTVAMLESVLELRLVFEDGRWLVDEMASRGSREIDGATGDG